jgi:uncharacterized zinc-type alcohol dehydrogenase-like protein
VNAFHAYAASTAKGKLEPFSFDPGDLGPEEAEIQITHCGVCHSDLSMLNNDWGTTKFPFVPGHEVVGTVAALGEEAKGLKIGQNVGVGWTAYSCLSCHQWLGIARC